MLIDQPHLFAAVEVVAVVLALSHIQRREPIRRQDRSRNHERGAGDEPLPNGSEKLTGSERTYLIRVGDYRVIYELRRDANVVEIQRVRHRKDVYR